MAGLHRAPCDVPLPEHAAKHNAAPQQIHKRIAIFIKQPTRQPETADYNSIAPSPALNRILQAQNLYNRAQPLFSAHRNPSRKTAMQYLGIALLILIFAEILSIVFIAKLIGTLAALCLMILAFMFGSFLMKRSAGLSQLMLAGGILRTGGQISLYQMLYPIRIPIAAFLLMLPGFFSDLIALLLLLPFGSAPNSNSQQQSPFSNYDPFNQSPFTRGSGGNQGNDGDIIEGDFVVQDGKPQRQPEKHQPDLIEHKK